MLARVGSGTYRARMDASEVVERSWSHFLTRHDEGFALWSVDQDSDDSLLTFPAGLVGEERALATFHIRSRETARVRRFGVAAMIGGAIFLVTNLAEMALEVIPIDPPETAVVSQFEASARALPPLWPPRRPSSTAAGSFSAGFLGSSDSPVTMSTNQLGPLIHVTGSLRHDALPG